MSVQPTPEERFHGVYRRLPLNADIRFDIRIEQLQTKELLNANVAFGIVDPKDLSSGRFLFYHVASSNSSINAEFAERDLANKIFLHNYTTRTTEQAIFSIRNTTLKIYMDGEQVVGPINIPSLDDTNKAFWIGYSLSVNANISAFISDFSVEEK